LKRVILQDVAAACGLSRSTVSLVAQDSPRASEQTKARVRKVMAELGYVYDRGAANLRTGRSMMVGLIMTDVRNPYFADLTMAVEQGLRTAGYTLLQGYSYDERARQERLISTVVEHRADGVILLPAVGSDAEELRMLARPQGTPAVLIARSIKGLDADYTSVDNVAAGELLGEHLRGLGARSVAFVGGPAGSAIREGRYAGVARALKRGGIALSARGRHTSPATPTEGERITHELLGNENPPDVIVAYSDAVAMGVLHALRDRGLRAGADIAVAGFDDVAEARYASPPLTSVATFPGETGALAARLLLARMADPQRPSESSIIAPRLHVRESTASFSPDAARLLTVSARPR
jgi:LacI family transcriptional regulator